MDLIQVNVSKCGLNILATGNCWKKASEQCFRSWSGIWSQRETCPCDHWGGYSSTWRNHKGTDP